MLFSEPKIPQTALPDDVRAIVEVSVLFSEPKIPQIRMRRVRHQGQDVSVLFSEPKIPQIDSIGDEGNE